MAGVTKLTEHCQLGQSEATAIRINSLSKGKQCRSRYAWDQIGLWSIRGWLRSHQQDDYRSCKILMRRKKHNCTSRATRLSTHSFKENMPENFRFPIKFCFGVAKKLGTRAQYKGQHIYIHALFQLAAVRFKMKGLLLVS